MDDIHVMKALVVEDDILLRRALVKKLTRRGFFVTETGSVPEATGSHLKDNVFRLVLLDREVGQDDGWRLTDTLSLKRRLHRPTRVILMSGNAPPNSPPHWDKLNIESIDAMLDQAMVLWNGTLEKVSYRIRQMSQDDCLVECDHAVLGWTAVESDADCARVYMHAFMQARKVSGDLYSGATGFLNQAEALASLESAMSFLGMEDVVDES